uniref:Conserved membrane protein n=1 Tax=Steinernema glaseri TaxID=37863 RepID=A0A1I7ZYI4_9BILA
MAVIECVLAFFGAIVLPVVGFPAYSRTQRRRPSKSGDGPEIEPLLRGKEDAFIDPYRRISCERGRNVSEEDKSER